MTSIVRATTSRSATLAPETWPALSQPLHQGQLILLQKHDQHCHSHYIKVSYSCSRNMSSIVTATISRSANLAPETWPALSQPQHQGQLLLLQKHDQHSHSHNIKFSYSCSRNMTCIVAATTSKSASPAPETWPALSQPQHQGQLLSLQKHDQDCQSHNIKVSYSFSRNMTNIVTAPTSRSATLAPETWTALSQPQHQGQLLLLQKHKQHCDSHNINVSHSCSRNMTCIVAATTSKSASPAPETWPALSQPQHQGQLLLLQKHDLHCRSHNIKISFSCSRNMTSIVTASASRSGTLAPETWPGLLKPQHQGQLLLLQKHDQYSYSPNIKVSHSCSRNVNSIVTATTSMSATLAPETWTALSQPQHQGHPLLLQKDDMKSIVTATESRSATPAPETWTALSQPQHQGQLPLLQKHEQHCHSHNIKVIHSYSRKMTWRALSQPQHQGQLLLLQKHNQHCHSHNIKVS